MYLDQTPMSERQLRGTIRTVLMREMNKFEDDDPIVEVEHEANVVRVITETGCVFHISVTKIQDH